MHGKYLQSRFSKPSIIPNRQFVNILNVVISSEVVIIVILLAAITATSVEKARWLPEFEMQKQCYRREAGNTDSNSPAAETRFQNVSRLRDRSYGSGSGFACRVQSMSRITSCQPLQVLLSRVPSCCLSPSKLVKSLRNSLISLLCYSARLEDLMWAFLWLQHGPLSADWGGPCVLLKKFRLNTCAARFSACRIFNRDRLVGGLGRLLQTKAIDFSNSVSCSAPKGLCTQFHAFDNFGLVGLGLIRSTSRPCPLLQSKTLVFL